MLSTLVAFSSITAALGNIGQSSYASANASMESLMEYHCACGSAAKSMQLPLVADMGMGAASYTAAQARKVCAHALTLTAHVIANCM